VRLRVWLGGNDPVVDSLVSVWPGANWLEREIYDLFGIRFFGHPDLRRILLPDDWEGHPLRRIIPLKVPGRTEHGRTVQEEQHAMTTVETAVGTAKTMVLNMGPQHPRRMGCCVFCWSWTAKLW